MGSVEFDIVNDTHLDVIVGRPVDVVPFQDETGCVHLGMLSPDDVLVELYFDNEVARRVGEALVDVSKPLNRGRTIRILGED